MKLQLSTTFKGLKRPSQVFKNIPKFYAKEILGNMKDLMKQPKSGRIYNKGGRTHQASAFGEAPAVDEGNLIGSYELESNQLEASIKSDIHENGYGEILEDRRGREVTQPAIELSKANVDQEIDNKFLVNFIL